MRFMGMEVVTRTDVAAGTVHISPKWERQIVTDPKGNVISDDILIESKSCITLTGINVPQE